MWNNDWSDLKVIFFTLLIWSECASINTIDSSLLTFFLKLTVNNWKKSISFNNKKKTSWTVFFNVFLNKSDGVNNMLFLDLGQPWYFQENINTILLPIKITFNWFTNDIIYIWSGSQSWLFESLKICSNIFNVTIKVSETKETFFLIVSIFLIPLFHKVKIPIWHFFENLLIFRCLFFQITFKNLYSSILQLFLFRIGSR